MFSFFLFSVFHVFFFFLSYFPFCFFSFSSVVRADAKTEKNRRKDPTTRMTISSMKIGFWCLGGQGIGMAHLKVTPFYCFSFLFFISSLQKSVSSSFFILCFYYLKYVSLLASVSDFNQRCFLRSRCSMEMWCPDDTSGLGHILGREHGSTPQSGVEALAC